MRSLVLTASMAHSILRRGFEDFNCIGCVEFAEAFMNEGISDRFNILDSVSDVSRFHEEFHIFLV